MVEHKAAGAQHPEQRRGIGVDLRFADVLGHADAGDRVERLIGEVAIVGNADFHPFGEPGVGHTLACELGL